ncbi:MAG: endonuclease domain-containing protein [Candidatus Melainabacteria bacterium]
MEISEIARDLRHRQTEAEALLWRILRNRRVGGFKFYRQRPVDRFVADFCCETLRVIVELDGGIHSNPAIQGYDSERQQILEGLGYTVLRFTNTQVRHDAVTVTSTILSHLREKATNPPPSMAGTQLTAQNPLLSGEGGPAAGGAG